MSKDRPYCTACLSLIPTEENGTICLYPQCPTYLQRFAKQKAMEILSSYAALPIKFPEDLENRIANAILQSHGLSMDEDYTCTLEEVNDPDN